jgi:hypothetical protein
MAVAQSHRKIGELSATGHVSPGAYGWVYHKSEARMVMRNIRVAVVALSPDVALRPILQRRCTTALLST